MTHPDYAVALDRSRPLEERRAAFRRWADAYQTHIHPGHGWHAHAGGNRIHERKEESR